MKIQSARVSLAECEKLSGTEFKGFNATIQIAELKEDGKNLEIHFENGFSYNDNFARMLIKGVFIAETDEKEKKKILEEWKKTKKLPNEAAEQFLMNVNYIATTVGALLAFAINIPAPVTVPRTRIMDLPGQPASKAG